MDSLNRDYNDLKRHAKSLTSIGRDDLHVYMAMVRKYGEDTVDRALEDIALECAGGLCSAGPPGGGGGGGGAGGGGSIIGPPSPIPNPPGGNTPPVPTAYEKLASYLCDQRVRDVLLATGNPNAARVAGAVAVACAAGRGSWGTVDWAAVCAAVSTIPESAFAGSPTAMIVGRVLRSLCMALKAKLSPTAQTLATNIVDKVVTFDTSQAASAYTFEEELIRDGSTSPNFAQMLGGLLPRIAEGDDGDNGWAWLLDMAAAQAGSDNVEKLLVAHGAPQAELAKAEAITSDKFAEELASSWDEYA